MYTQTTKNMEREIAERLYKRHAAGGFALAALESREADGTLPTQHRGSFHEAGIF